MSYHLQCQVSKLEGCRQSYSTCTCSGSGNDSVLDEGRCAHWCNNPQKEFETYQGLARRAGRSVLTVSGSLLHLMCDLLLGKSHSMSDLKGIYSIMGAS